MTAQSAAHHQEKSNRGKNHTLPGQGKAKGGTSHRLLLLLLLLLVPITVLTIVALHCFGRRIFIKEPGNMNYNVLHFKVDVDTYMFYDDEMELFHCSEFSFVLPTVGYSHSSWFSSIKRPKEKFGTDALHVQVYGLSDIKEATNNFSNANKLGQGGYGPVYKVLH